MLAHPARAPEPQDQELRLHRRRTRPILTERAEKKRFTPRLVTFLRAVLERLMQHRVASMPVDTPLLAKFTSVRVGDSTTVTLPADCAGNPGCGGSRAPAQRPADSGPLGLTTARLPKVLLEPGRHRDARSAAVEETPPAQWLTLWDLGYFCLKRFRRWAAAGAFCISRWQPGTVVLNPEGAPLELCNACATHVGGPLDIAVLLGSTARVACRLLAPARRRRRRPAGARRRTRSAEERPYAHTPAPAVARLDDLGDQLLPGVVDLERGGGPVPHPVADRTVVRALEVAEPTATHAESQSVAWQMAEFWAN